MHYIGGQWIILKGTKIRLDYTASKKAVSGIYIYIQGRVGEGQVYNST
jgi:hypothetical protein